MHLKHQRPVIRGLGQLEPAVTSDLGGGFDDDALVEEGLGGTSLASLKGVVTICGSKTSTMGFFQLFKIFVASLQTSLKVK